MNRVKKSLYIACLITISSGYAAENETQDEAIMRFLAGGCDRAEIAHILASDATIKSRTWNNVDGDECSLMHMVAAMGSSVMAEELVAIGMDVHKKTSWYGLSPLHYAAAQGNADMVKWLIERQANVNEPTARQVTSLTMAVLARSPLSVRLLLEAGANPNVRTIAPQTPILHAALDAYANYPVTQNLEMVRLLIERGADVGALNYNGITAMDRGLLDARLAPLFAACKFYVFV
jgi:ankyrin repeat protein